MDHLLKMVLPDMEQEDELKEFIRNCPAITHAVTAGSTVKYIMRVHTDTVEEAEAIAEELRKFKYKKLRYYFITQIK